MILREVIGRDPRKAGACVVLAEVVDKREHAVECLERALALDPGNGAVRARLATLKSSGMPSKPGGVTADSGITPAEPRAPEKAEPPIPASQLQLGRLPEQAGRAIPQDRPDQGVRPGPIAAASGSAKGRVAGSSSRIERILIVLAGLTGVILACLLASVLLQRLSSGDAQATPTREDVRAVLYENVRAANAEDLDRYMATIHSNSASYQTTESTLATAFEIYDLAYELTQASVLEQGGSEAVISFVLTTRKIGGPAFRNNRVTGTMILRKEGGVWKIFDQKISNVEYLD